MFQFWLFKFKFSFVVVLVLVLVSALYDLCSFVVLDEFLYTGLTSAFQILVLALQVLVWVLAF